MDLSVEHIRGVKGILCGTSIRKVATFLAVFCSVGLFLNYVGNNYYFMNVRLDDMKYLPTVGSNIPANTNPVVGRIVVNTKATVLQQLKKNHTNATAPKVKKPYEKYLLSVYPGSQKCLPPPEGNPDLPKRIISDPTFTCKDGVVNNITEAEKATKQRQQTFISCGADGSTSTSEVRWVPFNETLQTFRSDAERACLRLYVQQHCYDWRPVPDVIHLLWYGSTDLDFKTVIGLYSIFTIARPRLVILHGNAVPVDPMWDAILPVATNLVHVHKEPQTSVNGKKIKNVQNQADIGRIEILIEYGGIYLDSDMAIIQKLDIFRDAQFAANKAGSNSNLANGIMIAVPNQELLKHWLGLWQTYDGVSWGSHSVLLITKLAKQQPDKISALGPIFIKFGFNDVRQFYKENCSFGESYAAHIYRRDFPKGELDYIKMSNTTYGRLARFVLFGDSSVCEV